MNLYKFVQKYDDDIIDDMQERMHELVSLNEHINDALAKNTKLQLQMKYFFDRKEVETMFEVDEMVLIWNARIENKEKNGKFDPIQLGPYLIEYRWGDDSYVLKELYGGILEFVVHEKFLKRYLS